MALLNRPAEYSKLYDSEGRLQGGLSAMEELAQVLAMKTGEQRDSDIMDESEDELEPAGELPVSSDRTHSVIDSDEEMSSGGNSDEDMDDIAIDEPSMSSPIPGTPEARTPDAVSTNPLASPIPTMGTRSPSVSPSPERIRQNSDPTRSPLSRPRSSHSRRSLRRTSRRESVLPEDLPCGERLKKRLLETNIITDILVCVPKSEPNTF
jgi:serine/threonine-protein phosphatase 6 regulatory subunit 3